MDIDFIKAVNHLKKSDEFKSWLKEHKEYYLSYGLFLEEQNLWKIGFCNKESRITTFSMEKTILIEPEQEAFQEIKKEIKGIDMKKIKLSREKAVEIAKEIQKKEYPAELPKQTICIIQTLDQQIWNITFLTLSFNTLNIKIDTETGNILEKNFQKLFEMEKGLRSSKK